MSVRIYGRDYGGEKHREIVEYTNNLFPGRDIDAPRKASVKPGRVKDVKKGESSVLGWLRHRNAHARERVEKGLPARNPKREPLLSEVRSGESLRGGGSNSQSGGAEPHDAGGSFKLDFGQGGCGGGGSVGGGGSLRRPSQAGAPGSEGNINYDNDDDVSLLSEPDDGYSTFEQAAAAGRARALNSQLEKPVPCSLCSVTSPAWHLAVPRAGANREHLRALAELCSFNPSPPPKQPPSVAAADGQSVGSASTSRKKKKRQQALAAASVASKGSQGGNTDALSLQSSNGSVAPPEPTHFVGVAGAAKPLHATADLAWVDLWQAATSRYRPDYLDPYLEFGGRGSGCAAEARDLVASARYETNRAAAQKAKRAAKDAARAAAHVEGLPDDPSDEDSSGDELANPPDAPPGAGCYRPLSQLASELESVAKEDAKGLKNIAEKTKVPPSTLAVVSAIRMNLPAHVAVAASAGAALGFSASDLPADGPLAGGCFAVRQLRDTSAGGGFSKANVQKTYERAEAAAKARASAAKRAAAKKAAGLIPENNSEKKVDNAVSGSALVESGTVGSLESSIATKSSEEGAKPTLSLFPLVIEESLRAQCHKLEAKSLAIELGIVHYDPQPVSDLSAEEREQQVESDDYEAINVRRLSPQALTWRNRRKALNSRRQRQVAWMRSMKNLSKTDNDTARFTLTTKSTTTASAAAAQGGENDEEAESKAKVEAEAAAATAVEWEEASAMVEDEPPPVGWSPRDVACLRLLLALVRAYYPDPVPRPPPLPIPLWPSGDAISQNEDLNGDDVDDNGSLNDDSVGSLNSDVDGRRNTDASEAAASVENPTLDQPIRSQPVVRESVAGADYGAEATPGFGDANVAFAPFSTTSPLVSPLLTHRNAKAHFSSAASVSSIGSLDRGSLAGSFGSLDSTNSDNEDDEKEEEVEPPVHSVRKRREAALRHRQAFYAHRAAEAAAAESACLKAQPWRALAAAAASKRAGGDLAPRAASRAFAAVAASTRAAYSATVAHAPAAAPPTSAPTAANVFTTPDLSFSSTERLPVKTMGGGALLAELRGRFGFLGFDQDPEWALKGRPLMSRTYALREQGGLSMLHLASFLGHGNVAVALLEAEDGRLRWSPAKAAAAAAAEGSAADSVSEAAAPAEAAMTPSPSEAESGTADDPSGADAEPPSPQQQPPQPLKQQHSPQPHHQRRMHEALDRRGRTPLHAACHTWPHFRQARLVAALLERGADPNARDALGRTPLHYACRSLDHGAIAQLLAAGADPFVEALPGGYPVNDDDDDNISGKNGSRDSSSSGVGDMGGKNGSRDSSRSVGSGGSSGVSSRPAGPLWARGGDGRGGRGAPTASPAAVARALSLNRDLDTPSQMDPPISPLAPPSLQNLSRAIKAALKGPSNVKGAAAVRSNVPGIPGSLGASTAMVLTPRSSSGSRRDSKASEDEFESDEVSPIAEGQLPGDLRSGGLKFNAQGPYAFGAGPPRGATPLRYAAPEQRGECFAILSKGLLPDEATLLLAPLLAQAWVHAKVLKPFDRTDPVTKRSLAKAHAMKACDFPYYLLITGRIPRGASKDPRPGQKAMDKAAAKAAKEKAKANRGGR